MAISVKNIATGNVLNVSGIKVVNGVIVPKKENLGERFIKAHAAELSVVYDENGAQTFVVNDGYELVKGKSSKRQPQPQPTETHDEEPEEVEEVVTETDTTETTEETTAQPAQPVVEAPKTDGLNDALTAAFAPIFANVAAQIESNVRAKVQGEIDALKAQARTQTTRIELVKKGGERHEVEGVFCEQFELLCRMVNDGWKPYLWGAAGCGKSHTAEQIAKALGLDFYTQNMLTFAHEVAGYGNAAGEYVETPFFKAFSEGGLFFLDEADRSAVEGLVVLNQALEQGVFNFPVVGNVKAHPKFRFMCAGNTRMNGADEMYTSGQTQDASFKRRVIFVEMNYDRRIELPIMAQGDEVLVNFVEDVRRAIKKTGTLHFVSYTETRFMKEYEDMKEFALVASTFKSLDIDIMRQIYGALDDTDNPWAKALYKVVRGK